MAAVDPDLVAYDDEGRPFAVRYQLLTPLLLKTVQEQQRAIDGLLARLAELEARERP